MPRIIYLRDNASAPYVFHVHRFDGNATVVAKLLANSGFKSAYAIKGGVEGQNGWLVRPVESPFLLVLFNLMETLLSFFVLGSFSSWLIFSCSSPQDKELPWSMPSKSFNLNIDGLKNIVADGGVV